MLQRTCAAERSWHPVGRGQGGTGGEAEETRECAAEAETCQRARPQARSNCKTSHSPPVRACSRDHQSAEPCHSPLIVARAVSLHQEASTRQVGLMKVTDYDRSISVGP